LYIPISVLEKLATSIFKVENSSILKIEVTEISEMLLPMYQRTQCHAPEKCNCNTDWYENLQILFAWMCSDGVMFRSNAHCTGFRAVGLNKECSDDKGLVQDC
jgi:hypothetical protein